MPVSIATILVNWNGHLDTIECLRSLSECAQASPQLQIAPIVVDNGSTNDSVAQIRAAFPDVTLLETGENLGFTGGNNVGIAHALQGEYDYIFLLNNDTTLEPQALNVLVEAAQMHPEYALFSPVIHYFDAPEAVWFGGAKLHLQHGTAFHDFNANPPREAPVEELAYASGCAMLLSTDVMRQIGGFDDRFYLLWEDVDLSLRVRALGRPLALVPAARIFHKVSRSFTGHSSWARYYYTRNQLLFARTHSGTHYPRLARLWARNFWRDAVRSQLKIWLRRSPRETRHPLLVTFHALADHFAGRYGRCRSIDLWGKR